MDSNPATEPAAIARAPPHKGNVGTEKTKSKPKKSPQRQNLHLVTESTEADKEFAQLNYFLPWCNRHADAACTESTKKGPWLVHGE